MGPRVDEVMKLCCELSANQQIKTAVKSSGKGAAAAGGLAFAGGLFGGPLGIAVGEWRSTQRNLCPGLDHTRLKLLLQVALWAGSLAAG